MRLETETTLRDRFVNLNYSDFVLMDNTKERFVIDDISIIKPGLSEEIQNQIDMLVMTSKGSLNVLQGTELTKFTNNSIVNLSQEVDPRSTIIIFPGNGAASVKKFLDNNIASFPQIDVMTQRNFKSNLSNSTVQVRAEKTKIKQQLSKVSQTYIVIDDVIVTGSTILAVKNEFDPKNKCRWYAVSWMCLSPLERDNTQIFDKIYSSIVYQGLKGIPAVNSLSTLIGTSEKSQIVLNKYMDTYVENTKEFSNAIQSLRKTIYE